MRETLNLVFVSSKEYAQYLTVLLESIKRNNKDVFLNCYLLHKDIGGEERAFLDKIFPDNEMGKINYVSIDERQVREIFGDQFERYPVETCAKLFISWLVPEELERVLYLDIDMIVNSNLKELYNIPFDGKLIVACRELNLTIGWETYAFFSEKEHLRKFPENTYINTGMMLLAVKEIRKCMTVYDFKEALIKLDYYIPFVEQDIHSYAYLGKIKYVDSLKYNFSFGDFSVELFGEKLSYEYVKENVTIVHYIVKPWNWTGRFYREIYDIWWEYAKYTEFYDIWINSLVTGMREELRKREFHEKILDMEKRGINLSGIIREYFELNGYRRIGVYGAGYYGKVFLEHAPKEYEYIFFDKVVRNLGEYDVFAPEDLKAYTELDVIVFTPFSRDKVRYDIMKKTPIEIISLEGIVNAIWTYELCR